ncbi:KAP family P-loop domain-containing protein [Bosea lupini]|uniref:KAP family P-loop domain-containing protein n=2 Tax=Bosea lupini TaxID=1036779 RepID=A0A1H7WV32_9HYPH|nr:KAP family P-loop domain-containing protein [Bosea lupini]
MAKSKRPLPATPDTSQITTISASGEMREATPEEARAFTERTSAAAAERERLDGTDYAAELGDPRMEASLEPEKLHRERGVKSAPARPTGSAAAAQSEATPRMMSVQMPWRNSLDSILASELSATARAVMQVAGLLATRSEDDRVSAINPVTLLRAFVSVGLGLRSSTVSATRWLYEWALQQSASERALASFADQPSAEQSDDVSNIRLDDDCYEAMLMAHAFASRGQTELSARHMLIALLDLRRSEASAELRRQFRDATKLELDAFRPVLINNVLAEGHPETESSLWRQARDRPVREVLRSPNISAPAPRIATISGFHADRASTAGSDPLGINADVTAFARLICLEEARPPLSIGIFGEWGSGKSSFMERLQLEIADLTRKEREARAKAGQATSAGDAQAAPPEAKPATAPRFIENAVQIRFNAWHYADANLWASLTAEFFDQLRRGGYEGQRSKDYLALIGKVAERVRSLEASAQKAEDKLADAERAARHADEALASARRKLAASDLALASEHLSEQFEAIRTDKGNRAKLQEVGRRLYRDDLAKELDGFTATVTEAASWPGKLALVAKVIIGGGKERWLAIAAIVLVAFAGIGWQIVDETSAAVAGGRLIAWAGAAFAGFQALAGAMKLAKPVLDGAWAYAKAVEKARKDLAKEVEDKEVAAREAARALTEAQQKAKEAKAPLAKYGDGAAAGAPSTILRYFLFEDGDVRDYDKQVGLVSRARRSFEQLDAIFTANRDGLAARDKQARGEPLTPAETEARTRYEAMQLDKQGLVIPDRIVLYIDDLDRCTHQQVYDVLQAIHLLLAFELFVVVVGVDVRWVEEAVARQFTVAAEELPDNATPQQRDAARHKVETERRKRAIDYLEKIFQLPFWLRRLSTEGDKGGSYGAYVQELLQANLDVPENVPSPLAGTSGGPVRKSFAPGAKPGSETSPADGIALEGLADTASAAEDLTSVELALATVRLTNEEVAFLASPEIGAIALKSPRSVKRMLNVYRIVRARMSETELDEFLGRNGKQASWPLAAFLAAMETGQSVEIADAWYTGLASGPDAQLNSNSLVVNTPTGSDPLVVMQGASGLRKLALANLAANHRLSRCLKAMSETPATALLSSPPTTKQMLAMARIVRRYSFNRYH